MQVTMKLLRTLCLIAEEAGRAVMDVYEGDFDVTQKEDRSPLTIADMHADKIIRTRLEEAFPDIYILSEESRSTFSGTQARDAFFLVDPLDGTKEFIRRNGEFTVNIALVVGAVPVAGVVYAPALATMYYGGEDLGSWRRTSDSVCQLRVRAWDPATPLQVIGSRSHGADALNDWLRKLPYAYDFVAAGSSLKFCRIAEGSAHVYPRFGPTSQWDTAAAHCVLINAGGAVMGLDGAPLLYGISLPALNEYFIASYSREIEVFSSTK